MDKLLLIDGYSMAFRAFYGLRVGTMMTSTGQHTNAVYGFISMLLSLVKDEQPTHIAVAWDAARDSFRTVEYPDYKATRGATPPEFSGQADLIKQVLDAGRIAHLQKADFEADDIIATLAVSAREQGAEVLISSGDRDLLQVVTSGITVLYPVRGPGRPLRMTPEAVKEKYDVTPQGYPELAALVGETSDNLPGVPGVGPKTAAKWLNEFGGLDNLLLRADQVPGKVGESLRAHLDDVRRNRRLNELRRDVELPVGLGDLQRKSADARAVADIFDALEFRTLKREFAAVFEAAELAPGQAAGAESATAWQGRALAPGELAGWLAARTGPGAAPIALDVVGHWGAGSGDIEALGLAAAGGDAAWVDVAQLDAADENALANWLSDSAADKVVHSGKGPLLAAWQRGWDLAGVGCDTELAAYLLRPDQRTYRLEDLSAQYLHRELGAAPVEDEPQGTLDFGAAEQDGSEAVAESVARAGAVHDLAGALVGQLGQRGQQNLLSDVELPLSRILARMEATGIAVDLDSMEGLRAELDSRVLNAEQQAFAVVGKQVNLGSPKQLQVVLFDELRLPKTKKIKSGYTTDADALENLFAKTGHPFLAHLLEHRDAIKLRQIVDGLLRSVSDDGRIHTTYQQTAAATGRLSSLDPNLQNIPVRTETGARVREAFVAGDGFDGLLSADYSQIEMRVMADGSGDEALIEAFRSGTDFHTVTASKVFGVPLDQVTPQQRAGVKQMNYGLAYGLSAFGLASRLGVPNQEAKRLMDDYFSTFGGVRDYLNQIVAEARKTGYTETLLGRRRYLPDLNSTNWQLREMAERAALNAPIQGTAADIIKVAMIKLDKALAASGLKSRALLQVHDELILEVAPGEREELASLVALEMGSAVELKVPLVVSVGYGPSWAAAAH